MTESANKKRLIAFQADEQDEARLARIQERGHFPTKSSAIRYALIVADEKAA